MNVDVEGSLEAGNQICQRLSPLEGIGGICLAPMRDSAAELQEDDRAVFTVVSV